ncbi:hypothetical protein ACSAZK_01520 [Methanosarcina sp. Mfa9]|uniref:hypothetical protein n=1 Tax=Methanosarcina sp. Mfa9 TaxID=3439063 RepID=UPI003F861E52
MALSEIHGDIKIVMSGRDKDGFCYSPGNRLKILGIYAAVMLALAAGYVEIRHRFQPFIPECRSALGSIDPGAVLIFNRALDFEFDIRLACYNIIYWVRDFLFELITYMQNHPVVSFIVGALAYYMIRSKLGKEVDW